MTTMENVEKGVLVIDGDTRKPIHIIVEGKKKPITFNVPSIVSHSYFRSIKESEIQVEFDFFKGTWNYIKVVGGPVLFDGKPIDP
jgi:hypothetical protein